MKKTVRILTVAVAVLAVSAFSASNSRIIAQAPQMSEEKTALYTRYYENRKGGVETQKVAYELAQEFLRKFGADDDQYVKAVRKFVGLYEANERNVGFGQAVVAKDYPKAFEFGRQILNHEPDNFSIRVELVQAGYLSYKAGNPSLNAESIAFAKQALQLIDANKVTNPAPMATIEDARGYLNFAWGWLLHSTSPAEAAPILLTALKSSAAYKSDSTTYYLLGTAIFNGEYQQLYTEYKDKYAGKDESPEQKALLERLNRVGEKAIDALARAVALSTKPEQQEFKKKVQAQLTDIYKDLHNNSDAGLNELIAGVLAKPLP